MVDRGRRPGAPGETPRIAVSLERFKFLRDLDAFLPGMVISRKSRSARNSSARGMPVNGSAMLRTSYPAPISSLVVSRRNFASSSTTRTLLLRHGILARSVGGVLAGVLRILRLLANGALDALLAVGSLEDDHRASLGEIGGRDGDAAKVANALTHLIPRIILSRTLKVASRLHYRGKVTYGVSVPPLSHRRRGGAPELENSKRRTPCSAKPSITMDGRRKGALSCGTGKG